MNHVNQHFLHMIYHQSINKMENRNKRMIMSLVLKVKIINKECYMKTAFFKLAQNFQNEQNTAFA